MRLRPKYMLRIVLLLGGLSVAYYYFRLQSIADDQNRPNSMLQNNHDRSNRREDFDVDQIDVIQQDVSCLLSSL